MRNGGTKRAGSHIPAPVDDALARLTPERRLWIGVIRQAISDLTISDNDPTVGGGNAALVRQQAMNWLTGGSKDFVEVCTSAGVDPSRLRRLASDGSLTDISYDLYRRDL